MSIELAGTTPTADMKVTDSAPVEVENQTETTVETGEESAPSEAGAENTEATEQAGAEPEVSKGAEKRIKQLVAKTHEAEQRVALLESMLAQAQQAPLPTPQDLPEAPRSDQFETWEDYESARDKHIVAVTKHEMAKEMAATQTQSRNIQVDALFKARLEVASAEDPSIAATFDDPGFKSLPISPMLGQLIKESVQGPQIAKFLNENKALAYQLQNMHPLRVAQEIGKLEYQLSVAPKPERPEVKHVSQAPAPIKTVTPSGRTTVSDENLPIEEFMRRRNQKMLERQKASVFNSKSK